MISKKFKEDLKQALEIVWALCSVIATGIIKTAFFLPEALLNISPACISKSQFGTECFLCGMTGAFVEISKGNFSIADHLNSLSIYLFALFILNSLYFVYYLIKKIRTVINLKNSLITFKN